jgi:hypothetical protein
MEQYWPLITNMHDDALKNNTTIENLNLLCDLELIFGSHVVLPFLDCVYTLIKFAQICNIFIYDFIDAMKICQLELYRLYNDPYNKFDDPTFSELKGFETFTNEKLPMSWCADIDGEEANYLIIEFFGSKYSLN